MIYLRNRISLLLEEFNNSVFKSSQHAGKRRMSNDGPRFYGVEKTKYRP